MATGTKGRGAVARLVGSTGLSPEDASLVVLAEQLRDLGVKRFVRDGVELELSEAAVAVSLETQIAERARRLAPTEAGEIQRTQEQTEREAEEERAGLELLSA